MYLIVSIVSFPLELLSQSTPVRFRRFSAAEGLSQQTVLTIAQDQQGFLWFGTNDGLNRFDGYTFTVFRASADSSTGLHDDFISRLFCAKDGKPEK